MRFLFVANTPRDPNSGASGCDVATIEALRSLGHEVDEVWGSDIPHRIRHNNLYQLLELPRRFANAVDQRCKHADYDIIQVNECHAWMAAREHRKLQRRGLFINRSHGWEPAGRRALDEWCGGLGDESPRPLYRRLATRALTPLLERHNRLVVRYSDGIVLGSEHDRDWIAARAPQYKDKLLVLPLGVPDAFRNHPPEPMHVARSCKLLHVGQFHPVKGVDVVGAVATAVLRRRPDASFTWVCDGRHHSAARALIAPDVQQRVQFLDWMPRQDLLAIYDRHGIFLFPSYFEAFGMSFLEAMCRGLCVLATRVGGTTRLICDGGNGYLFDRASAEAMAQQALELMRNPVLASQVSANARATALGYSWRATAKRLLEFCLSLQVKADRNHRVRHLA